MKKLAQEVIVSGIQTSGKLHLGNYLGAIKNWVSLQQKYQNDNTDIFFFLADHHSLTDKYKSGPKKEFVLSLQEDTLEMFATLIAAGLDPKQSTVFLQSQVPQHTELTWLFSCIGPMHWLNTMTQYKEKKSKQSSLGLFSYPVLMSADILLYNATKVPVGDDQTQHLELTRQYAKRYNDLFGDFFRIPGTIPSNHPRVMSLRDGKKKMSKSDPSDFSRINLTDDPEVIYDKIRRATTDSIGTIQASEHRPEVTNLIRIYSSVTDLTIKEVEQKFEGKSIKQFKDDLTEQLVRHICPMGLKIETLLEDKESLRELLLQGSDKARQVAEKNLKEIKYNMGYVV